MFLCQRLAKLVHEQAGNTGEVLFVKVAEHHYLVHTAKEFRTQELTERLHDTFASGLSERSLETERALAKLASGVGGHDNDGVRKGYGASVRVGYLSLVKDLEQDVHDVGMRFFDLIEQHDGIGAAAHLFGQLSGLVIADISGRGAYDARDGVFLHKFGHIQPDKRIDVVEQLAGEHLDQLGFADAGRADKDEGRRTVHTADAHSRALDGLSHEPDGLVLADYLFAQMLFEVGDAAQLVLLDLACGNAGPKLDDARDVLVGDGSAFGLRFKSRKLVFAADHLRLELRYLLIVGVFGVGGCRLLIGAQLVEIFLC